MFRTILAKQWDLLSPAIQQHYGIKEGETIKMQGELAVKHGKWIKMLMPLVRLTGALVPVEGDNFLVTVENQRIGDTFYWRRQFKKDGKIYRFNSKMKSNGNEIIEWVRFGVGIRMGLQEKNGALIYQDKGYVFKLGKWLLPIPIGLLMGKSYIEEFTSQNSPHDFQMTFEIHHPWFGFGFSYKGYFNMTS